LFSLLRLGSAKIPGKEARENAKRNKEFPLGFLYLK